MQVILLKGKQGTAKTSVFGAALRAHVALTGPVTYIDCGDRSEIEIERMAASVCHPDATIIFETNGEGMPIVGLPVDYVVTVERPDDSRDYIAPHPRQTAIDAFLDGRVRVTMLEIFEDCLGLPIAQWSKSEQRRVGKALSALKWTRQRKVEDGVTSWFYAAPGYSDPYDGDGRFRQCVVCTGYYGRAYYGQFTPCPCGECEPAELYPPLQPEKSQQHDPALHHHQNAPSPKLEQRSLSRSPLATQQSLPADIDAPRADAQCSCQSSSCPAGRTDADRSCASPCVENERIAHPGPDSAEPAAGSTEPSRNFPASCHPTDAKQAEATLIAAGWKWIRPPYARSLLLVQPDSPLAA